MANNNDIDFDDLDFADLDFDIPDVDAIEPKDDRSPVTRAVKEFAKGTVQGIISTDGLDDVIRRGLPEGYALALNTKDAVLSTFSDVYRKSAKDLDPAIRSVKSAVGKVAKKTEGKVPKWLQEKLESLAAPKYSYTEERPTSAVDMDFSPQLAEIFKVQNKAEYETRAEDKADRLVRDKIEADRYNSQQGSLSIIARGMDRLVSYQDEVEVNIQRKSLELQFKQLALLQQIGSRVERDSATSISELRNIVKNTGLPEVNKLQMSELAKKTINERLASGAINSVSNFTSQYFKQLGTNASGALRGLLSGGSGELGLAADLMQNMSPEERNAFMATAAGSGLGQFLRGEAAMAAAPWIEKVKPIARVGNWLKSNLSDLPGQLDSWAKTATTRTGFLGTAEQFFKDILPKYFQNETLGGDMLMGSDIATYYDEQSRRSLTEIIPGLLTSINRWTQITATGQDVTEGNTVVYNQIRGGFTSRSSMVEDVSERILPRHTRRALQDNLTAALQSLDAEPYLTQAAFAALRRQLLTDAAQNRKFDAKRLANPETYEHVSDDRVKMELAEFFRNKFHLDSEGNVLTGKEDDYDVLAGKMIDQQLAIKNTMPAPDEAIRALSRVVGRDVIRQMGFIRREGLTDKIDMARLYDRMLEAPDAGSPPPAPDAPGPINPRVRGGGPTPPPPPAPGPVPPDVDTSRIIAGGLGSINVDFNRQFLEDYWGEKSLVIDELRKLRGEQVEQNTTIVEAIANLTLYRGGDGSDGGGGPAPQGGRLYRSAKWIKDKSIWAVGKYAELVGKAYKGAWDLGAAGFGVGRDALGFLTGGLSDVYVKGEKEPRLLARKFGEDAYYDAETLDPIKSPKDIKGPVLDVNGDYLITAEDFAKGLTSRGKHLAVSGWETVTGLAKGYVGLVAMPYKLAGTLLSKTWDFVKEQRDKVRDLYIAGEKEPRILARLLEQGDVYWSVTRKAFCSKIEDLVGEIRKGGPTGDVVVTEAELRKSGGWFTSTGEKIRATSTSLISLAGSAVRGYMNAVFSAYRWVGRGIKSIWKGITGKGPELSLSGDFQSDMVKIGYAQLSVQEKILQLLQELVGRGQSTAFDRDGDGLIDGSWQSKKKEEDEAAERNTVADQIKELGRNGVTWGGLASGMGNLFGKAKGMLGKKDGDEDGDGGGWLSGLFRSPKGKALLAMGGKGLLIGGAGLLSGVMENKLAGRSAGDLQGFKDMALNANPVNRLFGKAIRQGFGWGYDFGSKFRANEKPLFAYRLAQYDIKWTDRSSVEIINQIESMLMSYLKNDGGKVRIDGGRLNAKILLKLASVNQTPEDVKKFLLWFSRRFTPVFEKALTALATLQTPAKLQEIDRKLTPEQALEYLRNTHMPELASVYNELEDPTDTISLSQDAGEVEDYYQEAVEHYQEAKKKDPNTKKDGSATTDPAVAGKAAAAAGAAAAGASQEKAGEQAKAESGLVDRMMTAMASTAPVAMFKSVTSTWKAIGDWFTDSDDKEAKEKETRYKYNADSRWSDPAQLVRFYAYGMPDRVVFLRDSLIKLEAMVAAHLKYQGESAVLEVNPRDVLEKVGYAFAPGGMAAADKANWLYWYEKRFVPALLLYASEVRRRKSIDAMDAGTKMPPNELEGVLEALLGAKDRYGFSLWKYDRSPWPDVQLGTDPTIANDAMAMLKSNVLRYEAEKGAPTAQPMPPRNIGPRAGGGLGRWAPTVTPRAGETATGGTAIKQPGNGTAGDINAIPMPTGKGWDATRATIVAAAEMAGVDPTVAATFAGVESSFDPYAKNKRSTAAGLFQPVDGTWKELISKYGDKYGIAPNTTQMDPRANSLMAMEYIKENYKTLEKAFPGRKISDVDLYLAHFLGPTGARKFLAGDAGDQASMHVSADAVKRNPEIFAPGRTVGDVYAHFDRKLQEKRQMHNAGASSTVLGTMGMPSYTAPTPRQTGGLAAGTPMMMPLPSNGNGQRDVEEELKGEGSTFDGSGASHYLASGNADLSGMNPAFLKNFYAMVEEYGTLTGKTVRINDAFRSKAEQARLRAKLGKQAAAPGKSLHEFGLAMDIPSETMHELERLGLLKKYGFTRPVGGEPWHMEPVGIQGNLDGFKKDPQAAAAAILQGMGKGGGGYGIVPGAAKYSRNPQMAAEAMAGGGTSTVTAQPVQHAPKAPVVLDEPAYTYNTPLGPEPVLPAYRQVEEAIESARIADTQRRAAEPAVDLTPITGVLDKQLDVQTSILDKVTTGGESLLSILESLVELAKSRPDSVTSQPEPTTGTTQNTPVKGKASPVVGTKRGVN